MYKKEKKKKKKKSIFMSFPFLIRKGRDKYTVTIGKKWF
jgi:hypothetical protein